MSHMIDQTAKYHDRYKYGHFQGLNTPQLSIGIKTGSLSSQLVQFSEERPVPRMNFQPVL